MKLLFLKKKKTHLHRNARMGGEIKRERERRGEGEGRRKRNERGVNGIHILW